MIFYGQSKDSISSTTDSSGITEFMKYDTSNETVHFPKIVSIGNSFDNSYGCIYPDPSAILDLRTFTGMWCRHWLMISIHGNLEIFY